MRIPLVIEALKELIREAAESPQQALYCLGSAEFLLQFLLRTAEINNIHNMIGVRERIRDIQTDLYVKARLIKPDDAPNDPELYAMRALSTLTWQTLLGENPELLQNDINSEGKILHN